MAKLPQFQDKEESQRGSDFYGSVTEPAEDMEVEVVIDTQVGGMHGGAAGSVAAKNRREEAD